MQAIVLKHSLSLFQRCGWNRAAVGKTAPTRRILVTSQEDIDKYKTDTATLAKWLDFSVVKKKGRVYEPNTRLIEQTAAESFPTVPVYNLTGNDVVFPGYASDADVKLVAFSFKHYGFTLVRSWIDPYVEHFSANNNNGININSNPDTTKKNSKTSSKVVQQQAPKVVALEICFVEYGFLTLAKNVFTSNLRTSVSESQHANTGVAFGSIMDFAAQLLLPNKFTGYVYLLDKSNRIRWSGCGQAEAGDVENLLRLTNELVQQQRK